MMKTFLLALAVVTTTALAEPPQHIDVQKLTGQAAIVDDVVVPLPSEIFQILDKIGKPNWPSVLRPGKASPTPDPERTALILGTVVAEGFVAVEAEDAGAVRDIGSSVRTLSKALGVERAVVKHANAIIDFANKKKWEDVRGELDKVLADVKGAMIEMNSEPRAQLVSLGGWLRGLEALTQVVQKNYDKNSAGLLHQPLLINHFERRISTMDKRVRENPLVEKMREGLVEIRPLMGTGDAEISEKTVKEIGAIAERLVSAIGTKPNN